MVSIGIDFDGVIADTGVFKSAWILHNLGMFVASSATDKTTLLSLIGQANYAEMQRSVSSTDPAKVPPVRGSLEAIWLLSKQYRIAVLTARPQERLAWAKDWLDSHRLTAAISSISSSHGSTKIAASRDANLVALVDNDIRHLLPATGSPLRRVLFGTADSRWQHIIAARDWKNAALALRGW